jgi:hypothetical protein
MAAHCALSRGADQTALPSRVPIVSRSYLTAKIAFTSRGLLTVAVSGPEPVVTLFAAPDGSKLVSESAADAIART